MGHVLSSVLVWVCVVYLVYLVVHLKQAPKQEAGRVARMGLDPGFR
jgi:threonine/homoserine/homoserine lactone efflux protein